MSESEPTEARGEVNGGGERDKMVVRREPRVTGGGNWSYDNEHVTKKNTRKLLVGGGRGMRKVFWGEKPGVRGVGRDGKGGKRRKEWLGGTPRKEGGEGGACARVGTTIKRTRAKWGINKQKTLMERVKGGESK